MPISINSSTGIQMNDGNTLSRAQSAGIIPDLLVEAGTLLQIKSGVSFDGDNGITTISDPSIRLVKGDNVYSKVAIINATGTWTVPTDITKGYAIVVGGGGNGGNGVSVTGGDTPGASNGGAGGLGGIAASFIPLVAANTMPATVGAATGTTTFFGISATGGTNGTPGTGAPGFTDGPPGTNGTSSTGNLLNGNISSIWPIPFLTANAYGVAKTSTPSMQAQASYNFSVPGGGVPGATTYATGNVYKPGAAGTGGVGSTISPGTAAGSGLPGAVIIFY